VTRSLLLDALAVAAALLMLALAAYAAIVIAQSL
jgi:hypothetical protein